MKRRRIDVNLGELDQLLDQAREAPLSESDWHKIKTTLHVLVEILAQAQHGEDPRGILATSARRRNRLHPRRSRRTGMGARRRQLTPAPPPAHGGQPVGLESK